MDSIFYILIHAKDHTLKVLKTYIISLTAMKKLEKPIPAKIEGIDDFCLYVIL